MISRSDAKLIADVLLTLEHHIVHTRQVDRHDVETCCRAVVAATRDVSDATLACTLLRALRGALDQIAAPTSQGRLM